MKKLIYFFSCLTFATVSLADDTEIYGATAIDEDSRVNSNVLFIMDTSGSMKGTVSSTHAVYDPTSKYTGDYYTSYIYPTLNSSRSQGNPVSSLDNSSCSYINSGLNTVGKQDGYFQQNKKDWLKSGSSKTITCSATPKNKFGYYILHTGNYMNWYHYGQKVNSTRMEVVVDVVTELTKTLSNINLGLMRFDRYSDGGMIDVPISDIAISGPQIRSTLDTYYPSGGTPLEETMYEASRYYRGDEWVFGNDSYPNSSVSESRQSTSSPDYKSPIEESCQKNHIILLTDGEPSNDTGANGVVRNLIASSSLPAGLSKSCSGNGACLDELSYWLKNNDHSTKQAGNQAITTYTIGGFGLANGVALLKSAADFGGGRYFAADDTSELTEALESIFQDILSTDSTFTAPAVSVNAFNASEHNEDLFYALFRPEENVKWAGNVKKYRLTDDGIVEGRFADVPAISEATGFFNEGVYDRWNFTDVPDGQKIDEGGMANMLPSNPEDRNIFTNTGKDGAMEEFKDGATFETFDVATNEFDDTYNWSIGIDIDNSVTDKDSDEYNIVSRNAIGDPLHSEPVIANYGSEEDPDATIFFGTNEGFIHAVNTDDSAEEQFAFIPKSLHSIQKTYFNNSAAVANKPYGMDGKITTWFKDTVENNILEIDKGEHIYLYSGMRRGGRNYYGLNVSNRSKPEMLFELIGGEGEFQEMGQTWSGMTVARVMYSESEGATKVSTPVLFFGGGYDENQDITTPALETDVMGRAIYMVHAETGKRLAWIAGPKSEDKDSADLIIPDMLNSIPASVSAVDITGDGFINYLFAVDTGGKVFRIDINVDNKTFFQGGMIADLGSSADGANATTDNRRFYNKPNVSLVKDKQNGDYLTIAVGSGHRAHPILTTSVKNRFYVLKDSNISNVAKDYKYEVLTEDSTELLSLEDTSDAVGKVLNATSLMNGDFAKETEANQLIIKEMLTASGGWYIELSTEGEKVLAESTTFSGAVIFTTFSKSGISSSVCGPDTGMARIYVLDQKWGTAAIDLNEDGVLDEKDASKVLAHSGIAPRPVVIYRKEGGKTIAIGTETLEDSRFQKNDASAADCKETGGDCEKIVSECEGSNCNVTPVYWHQQDNL